MCVSVCVRACVRARACMMHMYDTGQCRKHFNSLRVFCPCVCGGEGGEVCLSSVWCFVWVVWMELCSTCVWSIIFRLICIM